MLSRSRCLIAIYFLCIGLSGCTTQSPLPVDAQEERVAEELTEVGAELFLGLIGEKSRLLDFQYRLNTARAHSCGRVARPQFGILTGGAESLDEEWLKTVAARKDILGQSLTILHVVEGSPFARAGLRSVMKSWKSTAKRSRNTRNWSACG